MLQWPRPCKELICYICKHNKLVQLVVQVKYHMNVIYSLWGQAHTHTHTHTNIVDKSNFKKSRRALAFGWHKPGFKSKKTRLATHQCWLLKCDLSLRHSLLQFLNSIFLFYLIIYFLWLALLIIYDVCFHGYIPTMISYYQ